MDNSGFSRKIGILKIHTSRGVKGYFLFHKKKKRRITDNHLVPVFQPVLVHGGSVYQSPVAAGEIANSQALILPFQQAMLSGDRGVDDRNSVRRLPPDSDFLLGQWNRRILQGPG